MKCKYTSGKIHLSSSHVNGQSREPKFDDSVQNYRHFGQKRSEIKLLKESHMERVAGSCFRVKHVLDHDKNVRIMRNVKRLHVFLLSRFFSSAQTRNRPTSSPGSSRYDGRHLLKWRKPTAVRKMSPHKGSLNQQHKVIRS